MEDILNGFNTDEEYIEEDLNENEDPLGIKSPF